MRSHRGRHRSINDMKNAKITHDVAMKFAHISDVRTFMGYGELTDEQTGVALEKSTTLNYILQGIYAKSRNIKFQKAASKPIKVKKK